jgi:predicted exporter
MIDSAADALARSARQRKQGALLWLLLIALIGCAVYVKWPQQWLQTDLIALLPATQQDRAIHNANARVDALLQHETLWLIGADSANAAAAAAKQLGKRLQDSGQFDAVEFQWRSDNQQQLYRRLFDFRFQLLANDDAGLLARDADALLAQRLNLLYSPAGAMLTQQLGTDPLGFFARYVQATVPFSGELVDGTPVFTHADADQNTARFFAPVRATTHSLSTDSGNLIQLWRDQHAWADAQHWQLHATGVPLFSAYGADSAAREINQIGSVSLALIVILLLYVFRSPRPLLLSISVVTIGTAGGIAGCILLLGHVHVVTLVFGAAITGVSVDYAIHYLCDSLKPNWEPSAGLKTMLPGLTLGMLTSVLAFALLAVAPFPGVRQVAVFAACGLFASWATTVLLLPLLARPSRPRTITAPPVRDGWRRSAKIAVVIALLALLPGLLRLHPVDDIRLFYAAPKLLQDDADAVRAILPLGMDSRFLLVKGTDAESVLRREEQLFAALDVLVAKGALGNYQSGAALVPSQRRQQENHALVDNLVTSGKLTAYLHQIGFNTTAAAAVFTTIQQPFVALTADSVQAALPPSQQILLPACDADRHDNGCNAIIALQGIHDLPAVAALAQHDVLWVDRVDALSTVMQHYRQLAGIALMVALVVAIAIVSVYAGIKEGLLLGAIPAMGMLVSLAVLGYTGELFSVFNLLALLLVVGVGMDYAIFYRLSEPDARGITAIALLLDVATTVLAMGMLGFSETPVIRAFGVTLVPGLLTAFFLAFLLPPKMAPRTPPRVPPRRAHVLDESTSSTPAHSES